MGTTVKRRYRSQLRLEQSEVARRRVVEAAIRLFAEKGYAPTTMRDLAGAAGVAVQTVYSAFGSKSGVADAIAATAHPAGVDELIKAAVKEPSPATQLDMCATIARRLYDVGEPARSALRRAHAETSLPIRDALEEKRRGVQAPIVALLSRKKALRPDLGREEAADVLWALTGRDLYELMVGHRGWTPDRYERWLAGVLKRELLARPVAAGVRRPGALV